MDALNLPKESIHDGTMLFHFPCDSIRYVQEFATPPVTQDNESPDSRRLFSRNVVVILPHDADVRNLPWSGASRRKIFKPDK